MPLGHDAPGTGSGRSGFGVACGAWHPAAWHPGRCVRRFLFAARPRGFFNSLSGPTAGAAPRRYAVRAAPLVGMFRSRHSAIHEPATPHRRSAARAARLSPACAQQLRLARLRAAPATTGRRRSRDRLREFYHFCLDHVRDYNRAWDFFSGMSQSEIEAYLREDVTWHRPTWPLGNGMSATNATPGAGRTPTSSSSTARGTNGTHGASEWDRQSGRLGRTERMLAVLDLPPECHPPGAQGALQAARQAPSSRPPRRRQKGRGTVEVD